MRDGRVVQKERRAVQRRSAVGRGVLGLCPPSLFAAVFVAWVSLAGRRPGEPFQPPQLCHPSMQYYGALWVYEEAT
jgi:hypothetical protein